MKPLRFPSTTAFCLCASKGWIPALVRPHGQIQAVDVSSAHLFQVTEFVDREAYARSGEGWGGIFVLHNYNQDALGNAPGLWLEYHGTDDQVETIQRFEPAGTWKDQMGLAVPELFDHFAAVAATIAKAWSENGFLVTTCFYQSIGVSSKLKVARWRAGRIERTPEQNALPFERKTHMATKFSKPAQKPASKTAQKAPEKPAQKPAQKPTRKEIEPDASLLEVLSVKVREIPEKSRRNKTVGFASLTICGCLVVHDWCIVDGANGLFVDGPQKPPREGEEDWRPVALTVTAEGRKAVEQVVLEAWENR